MSLNVNAASVDVADGCVGPERMTGVGGGDPEIVPVQAEPLQVVPAETFEPVATFVFWLPSTVVFCVSVQLPDVWQSPWMVLVWWLPPP